MKTKFDDKQRSVPQEHAATAEVVFSKLGWSVAEISELTGLSESFLRKEIKRGYLIAQHYGSRVVVPPEELLKYLQSGRPNERQLKN